MAKSTKNRTMERLEKIAETLGVDLDKVEPLPVITLELLEAEEAAAAAAKEGEV